MIKKIIHFFDKFEDRVRHRLSNHPILYAFIGGTAIVLFWRGIWHLADDFGMSSMFSLIVSVIAMLATGTFVSFFIGEQILISGLKIEKRIDQKTEEEIRKEEGEIKQVGEEIKSEEEQLKLLAKDIGEIKKDLDEIKKTLSLK